jgi:hypothetical protein
LAECKKSKLKQEAPQFHKIGAEPSGTTEGRVLMKVFERANKVTGWDVNDLRLRFQPLDEDGHPDGEENWVYGFDRMMG